MNLQEIIKKTLQNTIIESKNWVNSNKKSINLMDVLNNNEMIDKYFVKPDGSNNFIHNR